MVGGGFEPPKASPTDLQSVPFGRSGTPPIYFGIGHKTDIKTLMYMRITKNQRKSFKNRKIMPRLIFHPKRADWIILVTDNINFCFFPFSGV